MKLEAPLRTSDSELVALLQEVPVHPLFPASPASWRGALDSAGAGRTSFLASLLVAQRR